MALSERSYTRKTYEYDRATPRDVMGITTNLGPIETGKPADPVIVTGDPLTRIEDARKVEVVVKNGAVYTTDQLLTRPVDGR